MSNLKSWTTSESNSVLSPGHRKTSHGALLAANTRAQAELGLLSDNTNQDVRGQALRLLRMQQGRDPASLATQACISLRQLYQLESGETSLFYSKSLRNQAGRRVATILGAQWDEMEQSPPPPAQDKHLKLVTSSTAEAPTSPTQYSASSDIPTGLNIPAAHTVVVPPSVTAQLGRLDLAAPSSSTPARKLHPLWTLMGWLLTALAGAGIGSALAIFWGVRL